VLASPSFHPDSLNHPFAQSVEGDLGAPDHTAWRSALAAGLDDAHLSDRTYWEPLRRPARNRNLISLTRYI
jgi:hypothetical protein